MGIFGRLFGEKSSAVTSSAVSNERTVLPQLPEVETAVGRHVVEFQDRTNLQYILIFPVMHKVALKLLVEDFGVQKALKHYEHLVASLAPIREDQFRSFGWPEVSPEEAPRTQEIEALLWKLARDLIGRGILKETISSALVNVALKGTSNNPLVSAGFLITALKELRAGLYTPTPEVHPEANDDTDQVTKLIFNQLRDLAYKFKEHSGLEWQHLLPSIQKICVIFSIKYQGKNGALAIFRRQVQQLEPLLAQCQRNPPQSLPVTPLHTTIMSNFDDAFQELADSYIEIPEVHPVHVAYALSMLLTKLASTHYDIIYLSGILSSSCADIEQGKYDFVRKTH